MKNSFSEDTRVKIPATIQFMRLGYDYQSLKDAEIDPETKIFVNRFKPAIEKINGRKFAVKDIAELLDCINAAIKNNDLGKEFYDWLILPNDRVKLIDFENIENNDFAVVDELWFGELAKGSFRPDVNVLINGIPLAFLEVKPPNNSGGIKAEFDRMINKRLQVPEYDKYFNLIQFVTFSNNMDYEDSDDTVEAEAVRAGSFYTVPNKTKTTFSFFREEQPKTSGFCEISSDKIAYVLRDNGYSDSISETEEFQTNLEKETPCNSFITSFFDKERLMFLLHYGIAYIDGKVPQKQCMRYPQFFASKQILKRLENGGKSGIIWHTQGSGKTNLTAYCNRIISDYYARKGITTRFYFIVDRLDLLVQASSELKKSGMHIISVDSKKSFLQELNKPLSVNTTMDSIGEFTVVNVQKFSGDIPEAKNDYDARIQRIFFIDEAHRSYKNKGEYFKNLMLADPNAVYIALTGTPLLNKRERSNLKFGDYIHKYFYDKSIADGYTLRLKKENIDTVARKEIQKNLELEDPQLDPKQLLESDAYINDICSYIAEDFLYFRLQNSDNTLGAMIVCQSNPQARKIYDWFEAHKNDSGRGFTTGLVTSDDTIPEQIKKETQINFKENGVPDILVVNMMLTTGYSVNRLKKMYLLRNAHEHTLLQTISRVNRPYKSPTGNTYHYGYIVDFVDITEEYDRTTAMYLDELRDSVDDDGEDEGSLTGLVVGPEDILKKYHKFRKQLNEVVNTDNLELFSRIIVTYDREKLLYIRRLLKAIKGCHTEFLLSRATEYAKEIDDRKVKNLIKEVQNRLDFLKIKQDPVDVLAVISNKDVIEIIYEFVRTQSIILDLKELAESTNTEIQEVVDEIKRLQDEIKKNKNRGHVEVIRLDRFLHEIFEQLAISDLNDLTGIRNDLKVALDRIRAINVENDRLSKKYGGNFAFVKSYQDAVEQHPEYDKKQIENALVEIYRNVKEVSNRNSLVLQGRQNFIISVKKKTTTSLVKAGLYKNLGLKYWYDQFLSDIYTNLQRN